MVERSKASSNTKGNKEIVFMKNTAVMKDLRKILIINHQKLPLQAEQ
jgi:hypothetical protein